MIKKILILDNFDSFTFNIVDYFKQLNCEVLVYRNTISPEKVSQEFDLLVLSPGPSIPKNAGFMFDWIKKYHQNKPIFGICLGHQALIEFFGGELMYSSPIHGKSFPIEIDGRSIYQQLPKIIDVGRYHSLVGKIIPSCFEISGKTKEGLIMSIRHKTLPIEGVQYHPESILSMNYGAGMKIIKNIVEGRLNNGNTSFHKILNQLRKNQSIKKEGFCEILTKINENEFTQNQILMLLIALSYGLQNAKNLYQFILAIKEFQTLIPKIQYTDYIDVCGTGGSNLNRINTSTLVAFLLASKGILVIKNGNKASSGRFGSFDLIEKLSINIHCTQFNKLLEKTNLALVFSPNFYPLLKKFASARQIYGVPTLFNIIGPFLNPFNPKKQLIGTSFKEYIPMMIELGKLMNYEHLIIVSSNDGLDEITPTAPTDVSELKNGDVINYQIFPSDFGLNTVDFDSIISSSNDYNSLIAEEIINGKNQTQHRNLVLINAAFIYSKFYFPDCNLKTSFMILSEHLNRGEVKKLVENYKLISWEN